MDEEGSWKGLGEDKGLELVWNEWGQRCDHISPSLVPLRAAGRAGTPITTHTWAHSSDPLGPRVLHTSSVSWDGDIELEDPWQRCGNRLINPMARYPNTVRKGSAQDNQLARRLTERLFPFLVQMGKLRPRPPSLPEGRCAAGAGVRLAGVRPMGQQGASRACVCVHV